MKETYEIIPVGTAIDIRGSRFGRLVVLERVHCSDPKQTQWVCKCDCGNIKVTKRSLLSSGRTKSCGCLRMDVLKDKRRKIEGEKFGKLTVIKVVGRTKSKAIQYVCNCDCGKETIVIAGDLLSGHTKSCGCIKLEKSSKRMKKRNKIVKYYGKSHHGYKETLTDKERLVHRYLLNGKSSKKWRESVFKRDDYTCRSCFKRGGVLNAHHLNGWNWCHEQRFDLDNGITLCKICHDKFHSEYGSGNNTKEQFDNFETRHVMIKTID